MKGQLSPLVTDKTQLITCTICKGCKKYVMLSIKLQTECSIHNHSIQSGSAKEKITRIHQPPRQKRQQKRQQLCYCRYCRDYIETRAAGIHQHFRYVRNTYLMLLFTKYNNITNMFGFSHYNQGTWWGKDKNCQKKNQGIDMSLEIEQRTKQRDVICNVHFQCKS